MERRPFTKNLSSETNASISLQKKMAETRRLKKAPDLTDFMSDVFFGAIKVEKNAYDLTGGRRGGFVDGDEREEDFDDSVRSNSSKLTQEWLEDAKRMVASSPSRGGYNSSSRLVGSPRFATAAAAVRSSGPLLDRRDPLSRSARRHRAAERFSGEILSKSAQHSRHNSATFDPPPPSAAADTSPASAVQKWFSNILKQPNNPTPPAPQPPTSDQNPPAPALPPPISTTPRKSRFQNTLPQGIPVPHSKRTFKTTAAAAAPGAANTQLLSPPKNLVESVHRRSISSSTCSLPANQILSPPRTAHRKSVSSSTCSIDKISWRPAVKGLPEEEADGGEIGDLNRFLKEQRIKIGKILNAEIKGKAKIVLSGPSNSTSSMVAAICYAWLLENRMRLKKEGVEGGGEGVASAAAVLPVMNMRRGKMWKQRQVAWLFHHVGLDATALLFSDEVDLETLMMAKQLSILIVGQDILRTNGEVGSQCTILTDNYCEDAYDLLQTPVLKKLLLAGILLDTHNLNMSGKVSMTRDAEAVQLLLVGSSPNTRNTLYDQLMQEQRESSFFEALRHNYGKPANEGGRDGGAPIEQRVQERKSNHEAATVQISDKNSNDAKSTKTNTVSPKSVKPKSSPAQAPAAAAAQAQAANSSRGKNKFFLAKWFGFDPK